MLLDSPIPPKIRFSDDKASSVSFQFRLTLIRRNAGIAGMREGSLPDTSKQFTELFLMNTGFALRDRTVHRTDSVLRSEVRNDSG